jgi:hypothetical protein
LELGAFPQVSENSGSLLPVFSRGITPIVRVLLGDPSGPVLVDPRLLNEDDVEMDFVGEAEGDISRGSWGRRVLPGVAKPASRLPSTGLLVMVVPAILVRFADVPKREIQAGTRSAEFSWTVRTTVPDSAFVADLAEWAFSTLKPICVTISRKSGPRW